MFTQNFSLSRGRSSVAGCLPSICEGLGSVPSTNEINSLASIPQYKCLWAVHKGSCHLGSARTPGIFGGDDGFCIAVKEAKIGMVTHTCNANTHKTEARGLP